MQKFLLHTSLRLRGNGLECHGCTEPAIDSIGKCTVLCHNVEVWEGRGGGVGLQGGYKAEEQEMVSSLHSKIAQSLPHSQQVMVLH